MKILVTGSSGFLGGYLIEELLEAGHEVVGVDYLSKYGDIVKNTIAEGVESYRDKVPLIGMDWLQNAGSWAEK